MKQTLIFLTALSAFSAEYYVDASRLDDTGSATNWATAKQTIQAAVDLTVDGDTVWVTNGTYILSAEISVTNAITVQSVNGSDTTIIDGGGSTRCFNLHDSACTISGFTIRNGSAQDQAGGGVCCENVAPVVSNCVFFANEAICIYTSPGWSGGGMLRGTAINCVFDSNGAYLGGGIYGGRAYRCVFTNNYGAGGSQWGNSYGAGMSSGEAYNCLFVGNTGCFNGSGMYEGTAYNCTFVGNWTHFDGGALSYSTAYNCIFAGNGDEVRTELDNSQVYNSCSIELTIGINGNITNAPLFVNEANGNFHLMSNSPCINWGNNSVVSNATDLDGNPCIVEGVVDMGAYEYQGIIGLADSDVDGINDDWERGHGGNQNPDSVCSNGVNSILQAYVAGLDPNDPADKFSFLVDRSTPFGNVLRWQSVSGREYSVYYSTNLVNGFTPLIRHLVTGMGAYIDEVYEYDGPRYYKIDVQIDDNPDDNVTPPMVPF